jgi:hypothetical protein
LRWPLGPQDLSCSFLRRKQSPAEAWWAIDMKREQALLRLFEVAGVATI